MKCHVVYGDVFLITSEIIHEIFLLLILLGDLLYIYIYIYIYPSLMTCHDILGNSIVSYLESVYYVYDFLRLLSQAR